MEHQQQPPAKKYQKRKKRKPGQQKKELPGSRLEVWREARGPNQPDHSLDHDNLAWVIDFDFPEATISKALPPPLDALDEQTHDNTAGENPEDQVAGATDRADQHGRYTVAACAAE